jgi:hypothetical protein
MDITAGGDFLGLCDQKSSYKHVSDFGRLRSYGHFLIPYTPSCEPRLRNQQAGDVLNLVAYRLRCKHFCHLTRPLSYIQSSFLISTLGRYLRNAGKVGWVGGYSPGQCIVRDSAATTTCSKTLITYTTATVSAPDVQNSRAIDP